jgi:hypothetical protein
VGRETRPTAIGTIALPKPRGFAWSSAENAEEPKKNSSKFALDKSVLVF